MIRLPFPALFPPRIGNRTVRYSRRGLLRYDLQGLISISSRFYSKLRVSRRRIARFLYRKT
jgi:hypothetical protein